MDDDPKRDRNGHGMVAQRDRQVGGPIQMARFAKLSCITENRVTTSGLIHAVRVTSSLAVRLTLTRVA